MQVILGGLLYDTETAKKIYTFGENEYAPPDVLYLSPNGTYFLVKYPTSEVYSCNINEVKYMFAKNITMYHQLFGEVPNA